MRCTLNSTRLPVREPQCLTGFLMLSGSTEFDLSKVRCRLETRRKHSGRPVDNFDTASWQVCHLSGSIHSSWIRSFPSSSASIPSSDMPIPRPPPQLSGMLSASYSSTSFSERCLCMRSGTGTPQYPQTGQEYVTSPGTNGAPSRLTRGHGGVIRGLPRQQDVGGKCRASHLLVHLGGGYVARVVGLNDPAPVGVLFSQVRQPFLDIHPHVNLC
jgi:hypothetical protein